ncbi:hypothetical protein ACLK10_10435 [Escherichia coli]
MPAPVKEIRAGKAHWTGCFRQQRARGVLPFSLLHQKRRELAVGYTGQQGKLTLSKDEE